MATGTLGTQARDYNLRCTHCLQSGQLTGGTGGNWLASASVLIGTIPLNATILRITQATAVVSNAGTNNQVSVGSASGGTQFVATANGGMAALGLTALSLAASAALVEVSADTQVWVTNQCTGTAATTGTFDFICEYLPNTTLGPLS